MPVPAVPNTETFDLPAVIAAVLPHGAGQVDRFTKSGVAANATVTINGTSRTLTWNTSAAQSVSDFVASYGSGTFPDVTLANLGSGIFTATSTTLGLPFTSTSTFSGTGNTVSTTTAASSAQTLQDCFDHAVAGSFDTWWKNLYSTGAGINGMKQFRNYGGTPSAIPIPVATAATSISRTALQANWDASSGAQYYYIDFDIDPYFSHPADGYKNIYVGNFTSYTLSGMSANTFYYYRVRAHTSSGDSGNSNTMVCRTATVWFLPSLAELQAMRNNLHANGYGGLTEDAYYWSSSETYASYAYRYLMDLQNNSFGLYESKSYSYRVRACRTFWSSHVYNYGDYGYNGRVFLSVDQGGGSYIHYEAMASDLSSGTPWSNVQNTLLGSTGNAVGDGAANTLAIIGQGGHTSSAAKLCNDSTTA